MNIHVPKEIHEKYPQYEFIGKPIRLSDGKTYIRAKHKADWYFKTVHFYCFDQDFFWFDKPQPK